MIFEGDETRGEVLRIYETVLENIGAYVADLQTRVRMGTYDPKMHGTLGEILDEIERLLR